MYYVCVYLCTRIFIIKYSSSKVLMFAAATEAGEVEPLASSSRLQVLESELLIAITEIADAGNYTCNVSNTIGVATASAHLRVTSTSSCSFCLHIILVNP